MKKNQQQDLIIVGGGIMGLMTAYYASLFTQNITILEKSTIGNKQASSFSFTRSIRVDYLDSFYARLAYEAQSLWKYFEEKSNEDFFIKCGCLNIVKTSLSPKLSQTYAKQSYNTIRELSFQSELLEIESMKKRFPQFDADFGCFDRTGGFLYLPKITKTLLKQLKKRNITFIENINISRIKENPHGVMITTDKETLTSQKLIITTGVWVNDLLNLIQKNTLSFPITRNKPLECKYYYPSKDKREMFLPKNFPVFAYLDFGIYGHPIFDKEKGAVKISYYNPPDWQNTHQSKVNSVGDFVNQCLPTLNDARSEDVRDADQCSYDLVDDDNFIVGKLPKFDNIIVGAGWRGTGYKFAPLIGKILMQLALQKGTVYNIKRFSPERFL